MKVAAAARVQSSRLSATAVIDPVAVRSIWAIASSATAPHSARSVPPHSSEPPELSPADAYVEIAAKKAAG